MTEAAPGRNADRPTRIPLRGWWHVLRRLGASFLDDHLALIAAGVAYWTQLALFPAIALFVSLYGLVADPYQAADQARRLAVFLPEDASALLYDEMTRVAAVPTPNASFASLVTLLLTIWGSNRAVKAMMEALNVAYMEREKRNLILFNVQALVFTFGFLVFAVLSIVLVVALPAALETVTLGPLGSLLSLIRWPILFLGMAAGTTVLYRFAPSREPARVSWLTPGSAVAGLLWVLASSLISWYAGSFADFNKTYGSLGALVVLQTWMWVTALAIITGAKINAEAEHQTRVDTTTGRPKPLGERGAVVADSLAPLPRSARGEADRKERERGL